MKKVFFLFLLISLLFFIACPYPSDNLNGNPTPTPAPAATIPPGFNINVNSEPPVGNVNISIMGADLDEGLEVLLTAEPVVQGYLFSHWEGDTTGSKNPIRLATHGNLSVTAVYVVAYTLTLALNPGSIDLTNIGLEPAGTPLSSTEIAFPENTYVTIYSNPGINEYIFDHWAGDVSGTDTMVFLDMDTHKSISAVYTDAGVHALNIIGPLAQEMRQYVSDNEPVDEDADPYIFQYTITAPIGEGNCIYTMKILNPTEEFEFVWTWDFNDYRDVSGNLINTGDPVFTLFESSDPSIGTLTGTMYLTDKFGYNYEMLYNYTYLKDAMNEEQDEVLNGEALNDGNCIINGTAYDPNYAPE